MKNRNRIAHFKIEWFRNHFLLLHSIHPSTIQQTHHVNFMQSTYKFNIAPPRIHDCNNCTLLYLFFNEQYYYPLNLLEKKNQ
jgi:hypothetical protein